MRQSPSAISWWVPPGEVDGGRGFHLGSGDVWFSFSKLGHGPNEKLFVNGLWCLGFVFISSLFLFFLIEQRDKYHFPPPPPRKIHIFLEMDQLQSTGKEIAAPGPM